LNAVIERPSNTTVPRSPSLALDLDTELVRALQQDLPPPPNAILCPSAWIAS